MPITIRDATTEDIITLAAFNFALALETENKTLDRDELRMGVAAIFDDPEKGVYYIAEIDGRVVGSLMITTEWSDWENSYYWWIQSVYVHPDYRGKGIYKALYRHTSDLARSHGRVRGLKLYVERDNQTAKKVYEKLGMIQAAHDIYETPRPMAKDPPEDG
jgi:GNAT superfamily N-acetyltransferase